MGCCNDIPCAVGSNGKQWQYAGGALAAGDVAGHTAAVEAAGGRGLGEGVHEATHWDRASEDMAVGTEHVGEPCPVEALGEAEEGGSSSS